MSNWSAKRAQILSALLIIAVLMIGFLFYKNPNMGGDALQYHSAFHNLLAGKGWHTYDGSWARVDPGFGMLSYVFFLIFGDIEYSGMLVSAVSYLLMIPLTYSIVDFIFGKRTALLATFLVTFYPTLVSYSYVNLTDTTFTFFLLLGFSLFSRILLDRATIQAKKEMTLKKGALRGGQRPQASPFLGKFLLLGLILGIAYLIRAAEGLLVAGLVLVSLFFFAVVDQPPGERKPRPVDSLFQRFLAPGMTGLFFAIIALPYVALIHTQTGVWTFTARIQPVADASAAQEVSNVTAPQSESSITLSQDAPGAKATQMSPPTDTAQKTQYIRVLDAYGPSLKNIVKNVDILIERLVGMNLHTLVPLALLWFIYPFLSTKKLFIQPAQNPRRLRILLAFVVFSSPVLIHLSIPALHSNRWLLQYSVYILFAVAFLTVRFMERILESLGKRLSDVWVMLICLVSVGASLGFGSPTLFEALTTPHAHLSLRAAGLWLGERVQEPENLDIIAPRKGGVALFYASGKTFTMGTSQNVASMTMQEIGNLVNAGKANYLLLDNHYMYESPQLESLWTNPNLAQEVGLSLLHREKDDLFQIYTGAVSP